MILRILAARLRFQQALVYKMGKLEIDQPAAALRTAAGALRAHPAHHLSRACVAGLYNGP